MFGKIIVHCSWQVRYHLVHPQAKIRCYSMNITLLYAIHTLGGSRGVWLETLVTLLCAGSMPFLTTSNDFLMAANEGSLPNCPYQVFKHCTSLPCTLSSVVYHQITFSVSLSSSYIVSMVTFEEAKVYKSSPKDLAPN